MSPWVYSPEAGICDFEMDVMEYFAGSVAMFRGSTINEAKPDLLAHVFVLGDENG